MIVPRTIHRSEGGPSLNLLSCEMEICRMLTGEVGQLTPAGMVSGRAG